jgi:tRNA G18 (ribose-2'-O)-methylase SpoU
VVEKICIESLDLPELEPYRTMKWQAEHRHRGIFVAEGEKVVRRLLETNLEVISILFPEKWFVELEPILAARPEHIRAYIAEKAALEILIGFTMYQGVLALGKVPANASLDDIFAKATTMPPLIMAVEGVSNAQNLGGLIRNCAAFGAHGIIVGETCCSPYLRRSVRGSMGTLFKLPARESPSLLEDLRELKRRGVRTVGAHPHTDRRTVSQCDLRGPSCVVFGSEGSGLTPELLAGCDDAVAIPMQNGVDSLNVGTAGALFLYEAVRQRGMASSVR